MSICKDCFHSYVCEQFNEHRECDNKKCHFANDHFVSSADVVKVVRCEKCKFACFQYNTDKYPFGLYACKKQPTGRAYKKVKGNHFCSLGELKERG